MRRDPCRDDLKFSMAMALLLQGNLKEGLPYYEGRERSPIDFDGPEWRGQPLAGKHLDIFLSNAAFEK